jgi:hypothetical protein
MSRNWCVGEFTGEAGLIQARDTRDQLRRDGIDALIICTGHITFLNVRRPTGGAPGWSLASPLVSGAHPTTRSAAKRC